MREHGLKPSKNEANKARYGFDFANFEGFDAEPIVIEVDRFDYGEIWLVAFRRIGGVGPSLVYILRGETMWIVSLRRACEKEMRRYE